MAEGSNTIGWVAFRTVGLFIGAALGIYAMPGLLAGIAIGVVILLAWFVVKVIGSVQEETARERKKANIHQKAEDALLRRDRGEHKRTPGPRPSVRVPRSACKQCHGIGTIQGYVGDMDCPYCS